jgi:hypothetical protein
MISVLGGEFYQLKFVELIEAFCGESVNESRGIKVLDFA